MAGASVYHPDGRGWPMLRSQTTESIIAGPWLLGPFAAYSCGDGRLPGGVFLAPPVLINVPLMRKTWWTRQTSCKHASTEEQPMAGERLTVGTSWVEPVLEEYEGPLTRYAQRLTGDLETARDVVQETFLRLCRQRLAEVEGHLAEWLYRVAQ